MIRSTNIPAISGCGERAQNDPQVSQKASGITGGKGIFATSWGPQEPFTVAKIGIGGSGTRL